MIPGERLIGSSKQTTDTHKDASLAQSDQNAVSATKRNRLAAREKEILMWLARGKSASETGIILSISVCTVRIHIQNIKRKLNATNIPHAIAKAFDQEILDRSSTDTSESLIVPTTNCERIPANCRG